jgi:integrase
MAKKGPAGKPSKPYADYPLFAHAAGVWAKKIRGKLHYFGPWGDFEGALQKYLDEKDALHAGRTPRVKADGLAVRELLNRFMTSKERLRDSGEIVDQTFSEYCRTCDRIGKAFGMDRLVDDLATDDFELFRDWMAKQWGPVRLGNEIQRVRSVFKFGHEAGLIDNPVRYGPSFKKPSRKTLRKAKATKPDRMLEADEIRGILETSSQPLKTMVLLALNCGFGNNDIATLPMAAVNVKAGWIRHARPKTGIGRRAPLWPETVESFKAAITSRPTPKDKADKGLVFVTKYGHSWARRNESCPITRAFKKVIRGLGIHKTGIGFYTLRHVFATIASESRDQIATDFIMGHAPSDNDMSAVYRRRVDDGRLRAVTDHLRKWLFGDNLVEWTAQQRG